MKHKLLITAMTVIVIGAVLHFNLPSNDIKKNTRLPTKATKFEKVLFYVATSQIVANWDFQNLVVFKFAHSNRLDISMIGIPFYGWTMWNDEKPGLREVE